MKPRNVKILDLSFEAFGSLLRVIVTGEDLLAEGLPADVEVLRVRVDEECDTLHVHVASSEFSDVPEGAFYEHFQPTLRRSHPAPDAALTAIPDPESTT